MFKHFFENCLFLCIELVVFGWSILNILKSMPLSFGAKPKTKHSFRAVELSRSHWSFDTEIVFVLLNRNICHLCCCRCCCCRCFVCRCQSECFASIASNQRTMRCQHSKSEAPLSPFHASFCCVPPFRLCVRALTTSVWLSFCRTKNRQRVIRLASLEYQATLRNFPSSK